MIKIDNPMGSIVISRDVIANIAGYAASGCFGVVGMAMKNAADGFVSLLKKDNMEKGIKVTSTDGGLEIDIHIIVNYGYNIKTVSESIVSEVRYSVEKATGSNVREVTVYVDSMKVE